MENPEMQQAEANVLAEIMLTIDLANLILQHTPPKTLSFGHAFDMATKVRRNIIINKSNSDRHMADLLNVGLNFMTKLGVEIEPGERVEFNDDDTPQGVMCAKCLTKASKEEGVELESNIVEEDHVEAEMLIMKEAAKKRKA